jgi:hypothetical protein
MPRRYNFEGKRRRKFTRVREDSRSPSPEVIRRYPILPFSQEDLPPQKHATTLPLEWFKERTEVFKSRQFCLGCTTFGDALQAGLHGNIKWTSRQFRCQSKKTEADCFATFIRHALKHQRAVDDRELVCDLQILADVCSLRGVLDDDFSELIEGVDPFELKEEFDLNQWPYGDDSLQKAASPSPLSLPLPLPP